MLRAIVNLGGKARTKDVYPEVERIMCLIPSDFPEDYETYQKGQIKWKNKTAWAREYLKRKGQIDGTERGIWKLTEVGKDRVKIFLETKKDPDEGLAQIQGVFEFKSSSFKVHKHSPSQCDIVICWEHDWADCPLEVLCLKEIVGKFR